MTPSPLDNKIQNLADLKAQVNRALRDMQANKKHIDNVDSAFDKIIKQLETYKANAIKEWQNRKK